MLGIKEIYKLMYINTLAYEQLVNGHQLHDSQTEMPTSLLIYRLRRGGAVSYGKYALLSPLTYA